MKKTEKNASAIDKKEFESWHKEMTQIFQELFQDLTINEISSVINEIYQKDSDYILITIKRSDYDFLKNKSKGKHYVTTQLKVGCIELEKMENLKNPKNPEKKKGGIKCSTQI